LDGWAIESGSSLSEESGVPFSADVIRNQSAGFFHLLFLDKYADVWWFLERVWERNGVFCFESQGIFLLSHLFDTSFHDPRTRSGEKQRRGSRNERKSSRR
jgi:hypothetical protein